MTPKVNSSWAVNRLSCQANWINIRRRGPDILRNPSEMLINCGLNNLFKFLDCWKTILNDYFPIPTLFSSVIEQSCFNIRNVVIKCKCYTLAISRADNVSIIHLFCTIYVLISCSEINIYSELTLLYCMYWKRYEYALDTHSEGTEHRSYSFNSNSATLIKYYRKY